MRRNGNVAADLAWNCRFESCRGDAGSNPVVAKPFLSPQHSEKRYCGIHNVDSKFEFQTDIYAEISQYVVTNSNTG